MYVHNGPGKSQGAFTIPYAEFPARVFGDGGFAHISLDRMQYLNVSGCRVPKQQLIAVLRQIRTRLGGKEETEAPPPSGQVAPSSGVEPSQKGQDEEWYYSVSGEQLGPVSEEQVKQKVDAGEITSGTLVWQEGMAEWVPAAETVLSEYLRKAALPPSPTGAPAARRTPPPLPSTQAPGAAAPAPTGDTAIRCPRCASSAVDWDKRTFGGGKAIVGAVLLGPIGALAGFGGKKKIVFTCLKCGHTWKPGQS
jgi:hypothetical protein